MTRAHLQFNLKREKFPALCVIVITSKKSFEIYTLIHSALKMSRNLLWPSFHKRSGKANSSNQIELRSEFVKSKSALMLQCGRSATIWTDESETEITLLQLWRFTTRGSFVFSNQNLFSSPNQNNVTFPLVIELIFGRFLRFFAGSRGKLGVWSVKNAASQKTILGFLVLRKTKLAHRPYLLAFYSKLNIR